MHTPSKTADKAQTRRQFLAQRRALSARAVTTYSLAALQRLRAAAPFADARCVHVYVTGRDNELDTRPLIRDMLAAGKAVAVPVLGTLDQIPSPRVRVGERAMGAALIADMDELDDVQWGIAQPATHAARWLEDWQRIDLALVPGIAFGRRGERIGYGAGYYDRLLAQLRARRIGLCFECQLSERIHTQQHDVNMHWIVTEHAIYKGDTP